MNLVYSWLKERIAPDDWESVEAHLMAPIGDRLDPDSVPQAVVDEEMSLFNALAGQNGVVGG